MMSRRFFETLNEVCQLKDANLLFGGIQIILSGDFLQLPPVPNPLYGDEGAFSFESNLFKTVIPHKITLTEVVRQSDPDLVRAIREVSLGDVSEESLEFIHRLNRPIPVEADSVKLFPTNAQV
jgi:ATP-dependent DNA helicase PIF1